ARASRRTAPLGSTESALRRHKPERGEWNRAQVGPFAHTPPVMCLHCENVRAIWCYRLESEFERKLQRARPAALEKGIQAAQALIQHLSGLKLRGPELNISGRIGEIRMVQRVERIGAELQPESVAQSEKAAK